MRGLLFTLAAAGLAAMLSGCPVTDETGTGTKANAPAPATQAAAPPAADGTVTMIPSDLALDGITLGTNADEFMARYGEDTGAEAFPMWAEENVLGMVRAVVDAEAGEPIETSVFMDSRLVGFTQMMTTTPEEYEVLIAEMTETLGEPTAEPPVWAQESTFYEGNYEPVPDDLDALFWCDENAKIMLVNVFSAADGAVLLNLIDLENINAATDATMEALAPPMEEGMPAGAMPVDGEMTEAPPVDEGATEVPEDDTAVEDVPEDDGAADDDTAATEAEAPEAGE